MDENTKAAVRDRAPEDADHQHAQSHERLAAEANYRRRALQNPRLKTVVIVVLIILAVGVFFLWRYLTSYESTDDAQIDGHVNSISARISGHVIKLNVDDNQFVQAGTVLVEIDPTDFQVAFERAKADFADAQAAATAAGVTVPITAVDTSSQISATEADVNSARAGIQAAQQQYEAAKAQLQEAEANDVKAQNDLGRYRQLVDKQEISQQQYDQAVATARA